MTRYLRGVLALVVGAGIFTASSIFVLVVAVLSLGLARPVLVHAPMWIGKLMVAVVYRGILGMKIIVRRNMHHHMRGQTLVMANHPTMLLTMLFAAYAEHSVGNPIVFVGKRDHVRNPLVGWTLAASGLGILIDRADRGAAIATLRRSVGDVHRRGCALGIFPDQSRPTPAALAADQQKFAHSVPRIAEFRYTLVPRDGGIFACYDEMHDPRVVDITAECSVPTARWRDVFNMVGATYVFTAKNVTRFVPRDSVRRRAWIQNHWVQKNRLIAHVRDATHE